MMALRRLIILFACLTFSGCGDGSGQPYIMNGGHVKVSEVAILDVPINVYASQCPSDRDDECSMAMYVSVVLPNEIGFTGSAEFVAGVDGLIGPVDVGSPSVRSCGADKQELTFLIPSRLLTDNKNDQSTIRAIAGEIIDAAFRRFTMKVMAHSPLASAEIYFDQDIPGILTSGACGQVPKKKPFVTFSAIR